MGVFNGHYSVSAQQLKSSFIIYLTYKLSISVLPCFYSVVFVCILLGLMYNKMMSRNMTAWSNWNCLAIVVLKCVM